MNIAYGGILSLFLSRLFGFTYIMWAYGYEFWKFREHPFLRKLYLKVYHRACKVIAITRFVQERLMEFGVKEGHIAVVYPGTDPQRYYPFSVNGEFLSRYGLEAKKRMVLSVCRIIERKGIDTVIRALPRVKEVFPDVLYVISGDGDYRPALERLVEEEGLAGSVRFLGRVPDQDLPKLYNACEVFVMVSREIRGKGDIEGFGIVYLEANACAKPVIGSRQGGMKEAIEEGVSGLLVEPDNVDEVVSSLCRLLKDREFSLKLGRAGQQRVLETMNWDRCYKEFLSVLENSAGS
jgi:phosphatidylinositol alpha-1,6-mannosyltransferase